MVKIKTFSTPVSSTGCDWEINKFAESKECGKIISITPTVFKENGETYTLYTVMYEENNASRTVYNDVNRLESMLKNYDTYIISSIEGKGGYMGRFKGLSVDVDGNLFIEADLDSENCVK